MVLGSRFIGGWDTPHFGHAFSNCTYFRPCVRFWLSSTQRDRRVAGEKKKIDRYKIEDRNAVKPKSADKYVKDEQLSILD